MSNEEQNGFFAKPVLSAVLSREERMKLLENAKTFESISLKKLLKLIWWEYTKSIKQKRFIIV